MGELRNEFHDIGITGYPESHHTISDGMTIQARFEKAPMATYIVSQICFDAQVIATWIERVRARGTHLPIWIGVPGSVDHAKLPRAGRSSPHAVATGAAGSSTSPSPKRLSSRSRWAIATAATGTSPKSEKSTDVR
jgi:hypothetical protein